MVQDEYWVKRERKWIDYMAKQDLDYDKLIAESYNKSLDMIEKDINQFYVRYAAKEHITMDEARKKVSQFDVQSFSDTAKKMVEEEDFSDYANERLRLYNATMRINRLEMLKSQIGVDLLASANEIDNSLRKRLVSELNDESKRQAGILGRTVIEDSAKRFDLLIDASFHGATFSQRIWSNNDVLKGELDGILTRGLIMGMNPKALSTRLMGLINDKVKNARYAAERIARTESARVADQYSRELYREQGFKKIKWIAEPTACAICKPRDNKVFSIDDEIEIPAHPNCRCSTVPVMDKAFN